MASLTVWIWHTQAFFSVCSEVILQEAFFLWQCVAGIPILNTGILLVHSAGSAGVLDTVHRCVCVH